MSIDRNSVDAFLPSESVPVCCEASSHSDAFCLLESGNTFRRGGLVEASHVLMHLGETFLHVVLSAALPHCPETETPRWVMELAHRREEEEKEIYFV